MAPRGPRRGSRTPIKEREPAAGRVRHAGSRDRGGRLQSTVGVRLERALRAPLVAHLLPARVRRRVDPAHRAGGVAGTDALCVAQGEAEAEPQHHRADGCDDSKSETGVGKVARRAQPSANPTSTVNPSFAAITSANTSFASFTSSSALIE